MEYYFGLAVGVAITLIVVVACAGILVWKNGREDAPPEPKIPADLDAHWRKSLALQEEKNSILNLIWQELVRANQLR